MLNKARKFFLENNTVTQTFFKNSLWLFIGEAGVRVFKLALFIFAARKLGTSEWGVFSYAVALMSVFAIISDIGVNAVLIREKGRSNNYEEYIATGLIVKIFLSLIAAVLFLLFGLFIHTSTDLSIIIPVMSIVLFLDSIREFSFTLNRAFEKMEIEAFGKIIAASLLAILGFLFVEKIGTAVSLSYAYTLSSVVGLLIGYYFLKKEIKEAKSHFKKSLISPLLKEAWPLGLVGLFGIVLTNIDTVILSWFKDISLVGIYAAAQKPIQLIYLVPNLLGIALLPTFSKMASGKEDLKKFTSTCLKWATLSALFICLLVMIFGQKLIILLFGQAYSLAGIPFEIMALAIIISAPGIIASNSLFALGHQKEIAKSIAYGTITNIILCFLLIPKFNIYGGAIAATLGQVVSNGCMLYKNKIIINKYGK